MLDAPRLWSLLGYAEGPPGLPEATPGPTRDGGQRITFHMVRGDVPGLYIRPDTPGPHPAVLYCHAHGNDYAIGAEELVHGRPALQAPYGPALAERGIASLAIDLAPFGARQTEGPEGALAKAAHWQGRTLMGDMLAELRQAFDWLAHRHDAVGTLGLSMGATHAYWLAALEPRVVACAHLCALSDIAPLIETGDHDLHGPYMTVPGLITYGDMGDVAALIAPRPQLVCLGALDPLTPGLPDSSALSRLRALYGTTGPLEIVVCPETGHAETPAMRRAVLDFLQRGLVP